MRDGRNEKAEERGEIMIEHCVTRMQRNAMASPTSPHTCAVFKFSVFLDGKAGISCAQVCQGPC